MSDISAFVRESNKIEGILRDPTMAELTAHHDFLGTVLLTPSVVQSFVSIVQPGAVLRCNPSLNVRVGSHIAPRGGHEIEQRLSELLASGHSPYRVHCDYEWLHPFTDGNGRSGRVVWLWMMKQRNQMGRALGLGFLHMFYYQTLEALKP